VVAIQQNWSRIPPIVPENAVKLETVATLSRPLGIRRPMQSVVTWSPDGSCFAGSNLASNIMLFDGKTGQPGLVLDTGGPLAVGAAFSPDGTALAAAVGKTVRLYSLPDGKLIAEADGQGSQVREVAFSPDGKLLAFGNDGGLVQVWDVSARKPIHALKAATGYVLSLDFSPDGLMLAEACADGFVHFWNTATGALIRSLHIGSPVGDLGFSPDGTLLAAASDDNRIRLWHPISGDLVRTLEGHGDYVNGVSFSPDGLLLASGSHDRNVGIWDVKTGASIKMLAGHQDAVLRVAFSPNGRSLASISWDGTIRLWGVPE